MDKDLISRQQAIEEVKELFSMGDCYCDEYAIIGMLNTIPSVQSEQRWIPVTERLPEKSGYYLATVDIGLKVVDVIYFNNASGFLMASRVKAWKPRPEPYHGSEVNMRGEKYD